MDFVKLMEKASKNEQSSKKRIEKLPEEEQKLKAQTKAFAQSERARLEREAEEYAQKKLKKLQKLKEEELKKKKSEKEAQLPRAQSSSTSISSKSKEGPPPEAIKAFLEKKKKMEERKEKERLKQKEELLKFRLEKNNGKATKQLGKQLSISSDHRSIPSKSGDKSREEQSCDKKKRDIPSSFREYNSKVTKKPEEVRSSHHKSKHQPEKVRSKTLPKSTNSHSKIGEPKSFQELMRVAAENPKKTTLNDILPDGSLRIEKKPAKQAQTARKSLPLLKKSSKEPMPGPSKTIEKPRKPIYPEPDMRHKRPKIAPESSKSKGPAVPEKKARTAQEDEFDEFMRQKREELRREFLAMQQRKKAGAIIRGHDNMDEMIEEEDSDYDSDMDDFIDDTEYGGKVESSEVHRTLKEVFNYDKKKFANEKWSKDDDRAMVSNLRQMQAEEARSAKIAKIEDQIELLREQGLLNKKKR